MSLLSSPYLWLALLLILGAAFLNSPIGKGIFGEMYVNLLLRFSLDKTRYHLCKNVTLPTDDGSTQIDHLIVSRYGIFVVETKNMKGWIFGGERQATWTHKIFRHTRTFQNPLRQNFKHTKTLAELIGIHHRKLISLIIFVGDSTFKTPMPTNVVQGRQCLQFIRAHDNPVFTQEELIEIMKKIEQLRLPQNLKTHREHVAYLNRVKNSGGSEKQKKFFPMLMRTLLMLAAVISFASVILFLTINSANKDQSPSLSATVEKYADSADADQTLKNGNKNTSKELTFSDQQIRQAAAELLKPRNEVSPENGSETAVVTYHFEIELFSGSVITTDKAIVEDDTVTFTDKKGFVVSINKEEIRTLRKVKAQQ